MKTLNLKFALGAVLLCLGIAVCINCFWTEIEIERTRATLALERQLLAVSAPLAGISGDGEVQPVHATPGSPPAPLAEALVVAEEFALEMRALDARGESALGRLAALVGLGVLTLAWFDLRRQLEAASFQT